MPSLLLHAAAVERLAEGERDLPAEMVRALREDLEYARFGVLLPDLPWFEGVRAWMLALGRPPPAPRFARLFHERAPVAMGLKMAELVTLGALVGTEAGLACVCGYFTHVCLDRVLHPLVKGLVERHRRAEEEPAAACRRIEWVQAQLYLREVRGHELEDVPARDMLRVLKRRAPARGIGRGLYELVRLSAQESLGEVPAKPQVDAWVRGLYLYGWFLSSPLGRGQLTRAVSSFARRELYRGDVDFPAAVARGLELARHVLQRLDTYMSRGVFTPRTRARFLLEFPEGTVGACAA